MFAILLNLFVIRNFKGTLFICRNSGVDSQKKLESPALRNIMFDTEACQLLRHRIPQLGRCG